MPADRDEVRMQKKAQRKLAIARRRSLTREERILKSEEICRHLEDLFAGPEFQKAGTVFSYRAMPEEANVDSFNRQLEQSGWKAAYPVSFPNGIMKAAVPRGEDAWRRGAYEIAEPDPERSEILLPEQVDVVLVPCVAFDREGDRCGHGAGYYDRFLEVCRPDAILVMIAFDIQELEQVATEETDRRIPCIVTESGCLHLQK